MERSTSAEAQSTPAPSAANAGRFDAFISYARVDAAIVQRLRTLLGEEGQLVWIDVEGILAGADWQARIRRAIEACNAFVFVVSAASLRSAVCLQELEQTAVLNKLVIPVELDAAPPHSLPDAIALGEERDLDAGVAALTRALRSDVDWRERHTRLAGRAREWLDAGRDRSFVLRGRDLRDAEAWLGEQGEHRQAPTGGHVEYVVASRRAATTRLRALLGGSAAAVLLALALGAFGAVQRDSAVHERHLAVSGGVAAQARSIASFDPALGAALSLAAERTARTSQAADAVGGVLALLGPSIGDLRGHTKTVNRAVLSPDGTTIASGGDDGTLRLWNLETRAQIGDPLTGHTGPIRDVAFSPDGALLATAGDDKTVRLWDVASARQLGKPLEGHTNLVMSVAFSPDGTRLASASLDRTVRLWDVATRRPARRGAVARGDRALLGVDFSPDGKLLATADLHGGVALRDAASNRAVGKPLRGHKGAVWDVAFSPDGTLLATAGEDATVRVWNVARHAASGAPLRNPGSVHGVAFSPDGKRLAGAGNDVRLWDVTTRAPLGIPLQRMSLDSTLNATSVAFAGDGRTLVSTHSDGVIKVWNVAAGAAAPVVVPVARFSGGRLRPVPGANLDNGVARGVAFSPDSSLVASAVGTAVQLASTRTRHAVGPRLIGHRAAVLDVAFSSDAKTIATAGADATVRLWDVATRREIGQPLTGHAKAVHDVAFSPDGKTVASTGPDGTLRLWSVTTGRPAGSVDEGRGLAGGVAFSPDGSTVATGGTVAAGPVLRDARTLRPHGPALPRQSGPTGAIAYTPDGTTLAVGSLDGTVMLWNVHAGRERGRRINVGSQVTGLAISPDGTTLATTSSDHGLRLWDLATHEPVGVPLISGDVVGSTLAFSPDGASLATVGDVALNVWLLDAILWNRDAAARERRLCAAARRSLTASESHTFLPGEPVAPGCRP